MPYHQPEMVEHVEPTSPPHLHIFLLTRLLGSPLKVLKQALIVLVAVFVRVMAGAVCR